MASISSDYDRDFFNSIDEGSRASARVVVPLVLDFAKVRSVVDVGCGRGVWLEVFQEFGVKELLGVDGPWVDANGLVSKGIEFKVWDLDRPFFEHRRHDLAVSLEVAEHLNPQSSEQFVESLTRLSDTVLFSAAIPGQGGTNHVNEQWPTYWTSLFRKHGYFVYDIVRPAVWDNCAVEVWYRQNCLVFGNEQSPVFKAFAVDDKSRILSLVHPEMYEHLHRRLQTTTKLQSGFIATLSSLPALAFRAAKRRLHRH